MLDITRLTLRERRFLWTYLLTGNATQTYLALMMKVGSQEARAHTSAGRMLRDIRRKISWPALLENVDATEVRLIRELEADLQARGTAEGDRAAALLAELLQTRANPGKSNNANISGGGVDEAAH